MENNFPEQINQHFYILNQHILKYLNDNLPTTHSAIIIIHTFIRRFLESDTPELSRLEPRISPDDFPVFQEDG